jgi:outer membrane protein assembly factor BamB
VSITPAFAVVLGLFSTEPKQSSEFTGSISAAPVVLWERDLPGPPLQASTHTELGSPLIHGGEVLVGAAGSNALYSLDRSRGTLIHRYQSNGPVQAAPFVVDGKVIFSDAAGYTWCYRMGETDPIWKHYGGAPILAQPTVVDGVVYVANVGNTVYAIGLDDGQISWRHQQEKDFQRARQMELYGAPSPVIHGDLVLAGFHNGALVGLNKETGAREWQRQVGEGRYSDLIGPAVVVGGDAIVAAFSSPLMSLNLETQSVRWRVDAGGSDAPVVLGDRVYHGGSDGTLRTVDVLTGAPLWTWESPVGGALTAPVLTDAGVFIGSSNGGLYLLDEDSGEVEWTFEPGYRLSGLSAEIAVDGRQMVVVTNAGRILSLVVPQVSNDEQ